MKISSKGRYGLRILLELALVEGQLLTAREIAERQDISIKYTEQIVGILTRAGFIKSQRGSTGGYSLAMNSSEIIVGDVLRATEGSLTVSECIESPGNCDRQELCVTRKVWVKMQDAIENIVDNITLKDLVEDYYKSQNFSYII